MNMPDDNETFNEDDRPDLVFFYSEPLVCKQFINYKEEIVTCNEGQTLQTEIEYRRLVDILKGTERQFKIAKQAINFESLQQMLTKKPKMIHISCHGDYDQQQKEFYLQFEVPGTGMSDNFTETKLKDLLDHQHHDIQLAFVSACHSEQIGNILYSCGIPIVIYINQESEIDDEICLLFSRHLYLQLLAGNTVERSFKAAQQTVKGSGLNIRSCCCAHSHTEECHWKKFAQENSYFEAHDKHYGKCDCKLPNNNHYIDRCPLYLSFQKFLKQEKLKEQQKEEQSKPKNQNPYDAFFRKGSINMQNMIKPNQKEDVICCCRKNIPHDESMKFILKADEEYRDKVLFNNRKGNLIQLFQKNIYDKISNIYDKRLLIGRNKDIQKCVQILNNQSYNQKRMLILSGMNQGSRLAIAQYAIKYCTNRNYFKDGAYEIKVDSRQNHAGFLNQLFQTLLSRKSIKNIEDLIGCIKDRNIVLIIYNCDKIFKNDRDLFEKLLVQLLQQTEQLFILLILNTETKVSIPENIYERVQIGFLDKLNAAKMLKSFDTENEFFPNQSPSEIMKHKLFDIQLTNDKIYKISFLLKSLKTLDAVEEVYQQDKQNSLLKEASQEFDFNLILLLYEAMIEKYPLKNSLLFIFSQCPNGLILTDIQAIATQQLGLQDSWIDFFQDMIEEDYLKNYLQQSSIVFNDGAVNIQNSQQQQASSHGFKVIQQKFNHKINQNVYVLRQEIRVFINNYVLNKSIEMHLYEFLKYFGQLGRQYVRSIKFITNVNFDINILSGQIDEGLFNKPNQQNINNVQDNIVSNKIEENIESRFQFYEENFMQAFDQNLICQTFKESEQILQLQVFETLDEIFITYTTLLLIFGREQEAIIAIQKAQDICQNFKQYSETNQSQEFINNYMNTYGKLNLIKISINIKNHNYESIDADLNEVLNIFNQTDYQLGTAESLFLKCVWNIKQYQVNQFSDIKLESSSVDQGCIVKNSSQQIIIETSNRRQSKSTKNVFDIAANYVMEQQSELLSNISKNLQQSIKIFQTNNLSLCESRIILLKANFYFLNFSHKNHHKMLEDLIKSEQVFFNNEWYQHQVTCIKYISIIHFQSKQFYEARKQISLAIILAKENQYHQLVKQCQDILNQVQHEIQIKSNNLIVFLSAYSILTDQQEMLNARTRIMSFEMAKKVTITSFEHLNKNINIKYEILNMKQLINIQNYGCRILIIDSSYDDKEGNLWIEDSNGLFRMLSPQKLFKLLKPDKDIKKLPVDVVFINIMNGYKIGQQFKNLGVDHVFLYQASDNNQQKYINYDELVQKESMMMLNFTIEVIKNLLNSYSFLQSYQQANSVLLQDHGYQEKAIDQIKWLRQQHKFQDILFDQEQIQIGKVKDLSLPYGNTNVKYSYFPVIGRNKQFKQLIKYVQDQTIAKIIISGIKGSGKTRIVHELANFVSQRNIFKDGVYYLDFQNIYEMKQIETLFQEESIEYLLDESIQPNNNNQTKNKKFQSNQNNQKQQKNNNILLIYDNAYYFQKEIYQLLKFHVEKLIKNNINLKFIFIQSETINEQQLTEDMKQIILEPLSMKDSIELLKLYRMKEFKIEEFNKNNHKYKTTLYNLMIEERKIKLCQGIPSNLMMLALLLRKYSLNQIDVQVEKQQNKTDNVVNLLKQSQFDNQNIGSQLTFPEELQYLQSKNCKISKLYQSRVQFSKWTRRGNSTKNTREKAQIVSNIIEEGEMIKNHQSMNQGEFLTENTLIDQQNQTMNVEDEDKAKLIIPELEQDEVQNENKVFLLLETQPSAIRQTTINDEAVDNKAQISRRINTRDEQSKRKSIIIQSKQKQYLSELDNEIIHPTQVNNSQIYEIMSPIKVIASFKINGQNRELQIMSKMQCQEIMNIQSLEFNKFFQEKEEFLTDAMNLNEIIDQFLENLGLISKDLQTFELIQNNGQMFIIDNLDNIIMHEFIHPIQKQQLNYSNLKMSTLNLTQSMKIERGSIIDPQGIKLILPFYDVEQFGKYITQQIQPENLQADSFFKQDQQINQDYQTNESIFLGIPSFSQKHKEPIKVSTSHKSYPSKSQKQLSPLNSTALVYLGSNNDTSIKTMENISKDKSQTISKQSNSDLYSQEDNDRLESNMLMEMSISNGPIIKNYKFQKKDSFNKSGTQQQTIFNSVNDNFKQPPLSGPDQRYRASTVKNLKSQSHSSNKKVDKRQQHIIRSQIRNSEEATKVCQNKCYIY